MLICLVILAGCATSTKLSESGEILSEKSRSDTVAYILKLGKQCWERDYSSSGDALIVEQIAYDVVARRWAPDLEYEATKPMFEARVYESENGSMIKLREGSCSFGCTDRFSGFSSDVKRWFSGEETCR